MIFFFPSFLSEQEDYATHKHSPKHYFQELQPLNKYCVSYGKLIFWGGWNASDTFGGLESVPQKLEFETSPFLVLDLI